MTIYRFSNGVYINMAQFIVAIPVVNDPTQLNVIMAGQAPIRLSGEDAVEFRDFLKAQSTNN